jgi:hypothetical protein
VCGVEFYLPGRAKVYVCYSEGRLNNCMIVGDDGRETNTVLTRPRTYWSIDVLAYL